MQFITTLHDCIPPMNTLHVGRRMSDSKKVLTYMIINEILSYLLNHRYKCFFPEKRITFIYRFLTTSATSYRCQRNFSAEHF